MKKAILVGAACIGVLILPVLYAESPSSDGRALIEAQKCQLCHSIGAPAGKKKALDGVGKRLAADQIRSWIVNPKGMKPDTKMKSYSTLAPKELDALVGYLSSLKD